MSEHVETTGLGLLERLERGPVVCAEGYLFEFERRGYLQAGAFVPEVVLEHAALIALEAIRQTGIPSVMTLSMRLEGITQEGWSPEDACKRLEDAGADVVGLNCARGPQTMLPLIERIRAAVSCHVAALPVPYRTTDAEPTFQSLSDPGYTAFPN